MPSVIMGLVKGHPFQVIGCEPSEAACRIAHLAKISGISFAVANNSGEITGKREPLPGDVKLFGRRDY